MPATQPSITRIAARSCRLARYFFALLSFIALMSSHVPRAYAVTNTWTGQGASTNGDWSAATNWGGTAPDGGDNVIFAGTTGLTNTNNLAVNGTANVNINLLFATDAGAFVLNGTNATASALILTGPGVLTNLSTNVQTINFGLTFQTATANIDTASNSVILNGIIAGTNITKSGAATLFLNGANTYTGGTTINAGTVAISNGASFGSNTVTYASNGTRVLALANIQVTNNYALTGNGTMDVGANILTNTGVISGAGSLTKEGAGTLILSSATNTYGGTTTVAGGTLQVSDLANAGANSAIGTNGTIILSNGGVFSYAGASNSSMNRTINLAGDGGIGVSNSAAAVTISGVISNSGNFVKSGAGTMVLSASNSFSGTTTVSAGVLSLANTNALSASTLDYSSAGRVSFSNLTGANLGGLQGSSNLALTNASG
ncbi:MAG: autotransporter-associated beta strand repeat-containing protein, partial [Chthoniobacterales bacterium]